ncbi:MAG: hypothetical protein J6332_05205 [Abditibacteriota bacterium]|nr:hypothetical protein [Abditibacteriota bacterium]
MRYLGWHDHYLTEDLTAEEVRVPARVLPIPNNVNKIYYCQNFGHRDGMDKERAALLRDFNLTSTEIITGKMGYGKTIIEVYERRKTD